MKTIKPYHKEIPHDCNPYEFIEKIGRTCYKSTDKITPGSAEKFVLSLKERGHWAMLEHETVYFSFDGYDYFKDFIYDLNALQLSPNFLNISEPEYGTFYVSGNLRAFYELFEKMFSAPEAVCFATILMNLYYKLNEKYSLIYNGMNNPNEVDVKPLQCADLKMYTREEFIKAHSDKPEVLFNHLTHSVLFVCDRGVSHELVRHRPCSFAQESTRYCNYSKEKFGQEVTFIEPFFFVGDDVKCKSTYKVWESAMKEAEASYMVLLSAGATPQEARSVLPNSLKTEIIMTATEKEWQHICNLRAKGTTGAPHPQMKEVMYPWYQELQSITNGRIK